MRSWREIHASFDRLRERYYLDVDGDLMVPPRAAALRSAWTRDTRVWAKTHFDEEWDPHLVELSPLFRVPGHGSLARWTLMHELSHMRNPQANCSHRDRWWRSEVVRLGVAGAFTRESVF